MPAKWKGDGLDKAKKNFEFKQYLGKIIETSLEIIGKRLRDMLEESSPKDEGKFSKAWKVEPIQGNKIVVSNPDGKLFTMLEFTGRRPSKIKGKPLLHFQINGEDVFVRFSNHPGFSPFPFARNSMDQLKREIKKIIADVIRDVVPFVK